MTSTEFVVVRRDSVTGKGVTILSFYGPFDTSEEARTWAEGFWTNAVFDVEPLNAGHQPIYDPGRRMGRGEGVTDRFADACQHAFSNGTEGDAWMSKWCSYCVHDHGMHTDDMENGCDLILEAMTSEKRWGGEAWVPEPDDGQFCLPSRMVCLRFAACNEGDCRGDPGATERAERIAEVIDYWKAVR